MSYTVQILEKQDVVKTEPAAVAKDYATGKSAEEAEQIAARLIRDGFSVQVVEEAEEE